MRIISRSEWGARQPARQPYLIPMPTSELWLHHSAGAVLPGDNTVSEADLRRIKGIQNYHMDTRGWSDIAYNYLLDPDGNVFEGRGSSIAGGHTKDHNTISHGICVMGNYQNQPVDSDLLPLLAELVLYGYEKGWWPLGFTGGHRDVAATACPGYSLYSLIPIINQQLIEGDDMPLSTEDRKIIRTIMQQVITAHFGPAWTPTSGPQKGRRFVKGIVDSVWHAASSGRRFMDTVDDTHDYAKKASEKTCDGHNHPVSGTWSTDQPS